MKTIIPKGWLTKLSAAGLLLVTSPDLFGTLKSITSTFSNGVETTGQPLAASIATLVFSIGVVVGIVRRAWLK